jgi:hypothetical protein
MPLGDVTRRWPIAMNPDEITIAVTVFNRRQYLKQAITSALEQTVPVRVIVVEDCGPDLTLRDFVRGLFGARSGTAHIGSYHRGQQGGGR